MKTYGVGIVGAGFMGHTHAYNYLTMPLFHDPLPFRIRLVGVCDTDLARASKLRDDFGFEFATDDYQALLDRDDIHVIDVSTPTVFHNEQILHALAARKHVYADKPLCATPAEADEIVAAAEKAGLVNMVAYHYRFYPAMIKAKMLIDEGVLGQPISYRVEYFHSSNLNPDKPIGWKQDKAMGGGGVLIEMACHVLDLMYHLLGEYHTVRMESLVLYPERPRQDGVRIRVDAEDHVLLTIRMKRGPIGTMEVSKIMAGTNDDLDFAIYGTEGAIRFQMMNPNFLHVYRMHDDNASLVGSSGFEAVQTINKYPDSRSNFPGPRFPIGWLRGHVASQRHFVQCVHTGAPASPSFRDGAYIQQLVERIYLRKTRML